MNSYLKMGEGPSKWAKGENEEGGWAGFREVAKQQGGRLAPNYEKAKEPFKNRDLQ